MIEELIHNVVAQANFYLRQAGEFFPFASAVSSTGELKPVSVWLDGQPAASQVLYELEYVLNAGVIKGEYKAVALGIHVNLKESGDTHLDANRSALEIRVKSSPLRPYKKMILPYTLNNDGEPVFEEILQIKTD